MNIQEVIQLWKDFSSEVSWFNDEIEKIIKQQLKNAKLHSVQLTNGDYNHIITKDFQCFMNWLADRDLMKDIIRSEKEKLSKDYPKFKSKTTFKGLNNLKNIL